MSGLGLRFLPNRVIWFFCRLWRLWFQLFSGLCFRLFPDMVPLSKVPVTGYGTVIWGSCYRILFRCFSVYGSSRFRIVVSSCCFGNTVPVVSGIWFRLFSDYGSGFSVSGFQFRFLSFGITVPVSQFRDYSSGFSVSGLQFRFLSFCPD